MDARPYRGVRGYFGGYRAGAVHLHHHVYRSADEHLLGCACWRVPWSADLGFVQFAHLERRGMGKLFFVGVGLTVSNMFIGFIASPINCGALAMILSLVVVPLVSLVTPSVPFQVKMPTGEGAIDREIERELREERRPLPVRSVYGASGRSTYSWCCGVPD